MQWIRDCGLALKLLINRPSFSVPAIVSLALGMGTALAIFLVSDVVLLRDLPYPQSQDLVSVRELGAQNNTMAVADPNFRDLRDAAASFSSIAQYAGGIDLVINGNQSRRVDTEAVSPAFFNVLGVAPMLGRGFDDKVDAGDAHIAVISQGLWLELFGAETDLSKLNLETSGEHLKVIGVMPASFVFPAQTAVWFPRSLFPAEYSRTAHNWNVVARLRHDTPLDIARSDASGIGQRLHTQYGDTTDAAGFQLIPLRQQIVGKAQAALWSLCAGATFLLLIAGVNTLNLFLALGLSRRKDMAVRAALGASQVRVIRQTMLESVLLTLIAFALALLFASGCLRVLIGLAGDSLPRAREIDFDPMVVITMLGVAIFFALGIGILPHLRGRQTARDLSGRGRGTTMGKSGARLRAGLLVAQTALTVVLLIGAGLLGKSFLHVLDVAPGFRAQGVVAAELTLPSGDISKNADANAQRYATLMSHLAEIPGVTSVGGIDALPLSHNGANGSFWDGVTVPKLKDVNNLPKPIGQAGYRIASVGYFSAMGISLIRGRSFESTDTATATPVGVISETLARSVYADRDPIGTQIQFGNMDGDERPITVVGVVGDVRDDGLDRDVGGVVYVNVAQRGAKATNFSIVLRSELDSASITAAARTQLRRYEPELPVSFHTMNDVVHASLGTRPFTLILFGLFAAVSLCLALSGIYGLVAYAASERRSEFALRMAVGSSPSQVLRLVLRQGFVLIAASLVVGSLGALALTRLLQNQLFGVGAFDAATFAMVSLLLLVASQLACAIPAWRAARVPPIVSLG